MDDFIFGPEQVKKEGESFPCGFTSLSISNPWPGLESHTTPATFLDRGPDPFKKKKKSAFNVATFHFGLMWGNKLFGSL